MKLQLALDLVDINGAIEVVKEVESHVDVVEIGTPVVINEGLKAVKEVKKAFPDMTVLADLKIMDAAVTKSARRLLPVQTSLPSLGLLKTNPSKERLRKRRTKANRSLLT